MKKEANDLTREHIIKHRNLVELLFTNDFSDVIDKISDACIESLVNGGKIIFMGNGGSAADAQHLAAELVGRYLEKRKGLAAIALTTNTSTITALANDFSYTEVFTRQVEAIAKPGDVLIGITTSGRSKNIISGFKAAKEIGARIIAFTGAFTNELDGICDIILAIPENFTPVIQEMHIMAGHIMCGLIEQKLKTQRET